MIDMQLKVHIRWMVRRDMPEVLGIENDSFEFPWEEADFIALLQQRNGIGIVAEVNDKVVAFCCYELHHRKIHVINFAVHPDWRRKCIGMEMLAKLRGKLTPNRRTAIMLEVRESNLAAQMFFRQAGFTATHILRGFYQDTTEDAYLFEYRLPSCGTRFGNLYPR